MTLTLGILLLVSVYMLLGATAGRGDVSSRAELRETRAVTDTLRARKCLPAVSWAQRPRLIPAASLRFYTRKARRWHVRSMYAGQHCDPIRPPGTVRLGKIMAADAGWTGAQWDCLHRLWDALESRWYVYAHNPSSGAHGIPQALPGWKMGPGWEDSARVQIRWGLDYVRGRYGTPCGALSFRLGHGWY